MSNNNSIYLNKEEFLLFLECSYHYDFQDLVPKSLGENTSFHEVFKNDFKGFIFQMRGINEDYAHFYNSLVFDALYPHINSYEHMCLDYMMDNHSYLYSKAELKSLNERKKEFINREQKYYYKLPEEVYKKIKEEIVLNMCEVDLFRTVGSEIKEKNTRYRRKRKKKKRMGDHSI